MTDALATTRARYEATPRALDAELLRMARGDRGCLGDALAGSGAVAIIVFGVLGSLGMLSFMYMLVGTLMLMAGFILSSLAQVRSAPQRRLALSDGPLVLARVVKADPVLYEPSDAVLPARVVYAPGSARRFDGEFLRALGQRLQALDRADATPPELAAVLAVLRQPNRVETVRIPSTLVGDEEVYLAVVSVDARRLPAGRIEDGEITLIVDPRSGFAEHI